MTARRWLAALMLAASALAHAGDVRPGPRAIWIWEAESYAMLEDDAAARTAIAFLKDKAIGTAYVYADAYEGRNLIAAQPARYRTLVRRMHAAGLKVQALLGSGYLHTERYLLPEHRRAAQAMLQRVLDYNAAAAPQERFDGIVGHARDELDYAAKIGKPVVIGVETMPNAIRKVSFHHLREEDMERELAATARAVAASPGFGGFAIHHYAAYRRWLGVD